MSKLLSPDGPGTKKKAQHFTGLFSISKTIHTKFKRVALAPLLDDLLRQSVLSSTKQHPEQEAVMQHIWSAAQTAQPPASSDLQIQLVGANRIQRITAQISKVLEQSHARFCQ